MLQNYCSCTIGKSSSAKAALCCWGAQTVNFKGCRSTVSSIVNQSSTSTIPIVVDDIASPHAMEEMAVQFSGGASHSTIASGSATPRSGIMVTANRTFADSDRFVIAHSIITLCKNGLTFYRNAVRLLYIPFWPINVDNTIDRNLLEEELRIACDNASKCVGLFISMGIALKSVEFNRRFHQFFLPLVRGELPVLQNRVHRSYALLLAITEKVLYKVLYYMDNFFTFYYTCSYVSTLMPRLYHSLRLRCSSRTF